MLLIGLTGSIGMGKSTTLELFKQEGVAGYDADAAVHALYEKGGAGALALSPLFPDAIKKGAVDRETLSKIVLHDEAAMQQLEKTIHPLVQQAREAFLLEQAEAGAFAVILDIPLLFESGSGDYFDVVITVSAPPKLQRERVLARPNMSVEKFEAILAKQVPDAEKCAKSDFVVDSSVSEEDAHRQIREILAKIKQMRDEPEKNGG